MNKIKDHKQQQKRAFAHFRRFGHCNLEFVWDLGFVIRDLYNSTTGLFFKKLKRYKRLIFNSLHSLCKATARLAPTPYPLLHLTIFSLITILFSGQAITGEGWNRSPLLLTAFEQGADRGLILHAANKRAFKRATFTMGSLIEITAYGDNEKRVDNAINKAFHEVKRLDNLMSNYKQDSELSRINREAVKAPIACDPELIYIIEQSLLYSQITDGAFDITVYPFVNLWGFFGNDNGNIVGNLPLEKELKDLSSAVSYKNIVIEDKDANNQEDSGGKTIFLKDPLTQIDLGGIGKGYAVDIVSDILKKEGISSALINFAGNIYAFGSPQGREEWIVGVRDPKDSQNVLATFKIKDKAVATSGNYERFFLKDGKRYSHIIDPRTGKPVEGVLSVTIMADNAIAADALSTGVFVLGTDEGLKLIERLDNVECLIISEDKDSHIMINTSKGFKEIFD